MIQPAARRFARKAEPPAGCPTGGSELFRYELSAQAGLRLAMWTLVALLYRTIRSRVVLIPIDIAAHLILLMIHLSAFLAGQAPAIRCAIRANLLMDRRFFAFEVAGFARRQLARANALSDASLLIRLPFVAAAVGRIRGPAMIFRCEVCVI